MMQCVQHEMQQFFTVSIAAITYGTKILTPVQKSGTNPLK